MQTKHKTKQITVNHIRISYIEAGPIEAPVILFFTAFLLTNPCGVSSFHFYRKILESLLWILEDMVKVI